MVSNRDKSLMLTSRCERNFLINGSFRVEIQPFLIFIRLFLLTGDRNSLLNNLSRIVSCLRVGVGDVLGPGGEVW